MSRGKGTAKLPASEVVEAAIVGQSDTSIATLAAELLDAFGGPAQLAKSYKAEFTHGKEGGMARQRMLEGILRIVSQASAQQQEAPIGDMTEADLQAQLLAILERRGLVSTENNGSGEEQRPA